MNRPTARDIERAALQMREAAQRLMSGAALLSTVGPLGPAPNRTLNTMVEDAARIDAITSLLDGGDCLAEAIEEVMVRGFRPHVEGAAAAMQL